MKVFKLWLLEKMIKLCNLGLTYSDAADSQEEVNEVIATKNYLIKKRDKLTKDNQRG